MVWEHCTYGGQAALKQCVNRRGMVLAKWVLRVVEDERAVADGAVGICAEVFVCGVLGVGGVSRMVSLGTSPGPTHKWSGDFQ
jgi:hypothetical protein